MNAISLAVADDFTVDAYFDIEEGQITTENHDVRIYRVDIHKIMFEFNSGMSIDITSSIPDKDMKSIENRILDYHLHSK